MSNTAQQAAEGGIKKTGRRPWRAAVNVGLIMAVIAALGAGGWTALHGGARQTAYLTAPVVRGDVEQAVLATGILEPARLVSVGSQVTGQVKALHAALGETVAAGDVIAEIDSTNQVNAVRVAQTSLASAQAQRRAAAAQLHEAELTFERRARLRETRAVSDADYQSAETELESLRAQIASYDAQIAAAEVQLEIAETDLGYTRITAPMDGVVIAIVVEEGQTVNAAQASPTIVKLAQLDTMTVSAEISEADIDKVHKGLRVSFTTMGDGAEPRDAVLRAIEPTPRDIESTDSIQASDARATYYNALFDVANADGALRTWMTVEVRIIIAEASDALLAPVAALGPATPDGARMVRVMTSDGEPEPRPVLVGVSDGANIEVLEGLSEGDRLVIGLSDGSVAEPDDMARRGPPGGGMMMGPPPGGRR